MLCTTYTVKTWTVVKEAVKMVVKMVSKPYVYLHFRKNKQDVNKLLLEKQIFYNKYINPSGRQKIYVYIHVYDRQIQIKRYKQKYSTQHNPTIHRTKTRNRQFNISWRFQQQIFNNRENQIEVRRIIYSKNTHSVICTLGHYPQQIMHLATERPSINLKGLFLQSKFSEQKLKLKINTEGNSQM